MNKVDSEERNLYKWLKNYNRELAEKYHEKFRDDDYNNELKKGLLLLLLLL